MSGDTWTVERIASYGVRMPGVDAAMAVLGCSKRKAYDLLHAGDVPFPVIKWGRKYVTPTAAVLRLLEVDQAGSKAA